ncbi:hypothetical protein LPJ56_007043 [Coemansia sp. RSA 2599]|nr:hypothetical protein LPJ56_007043 [Coemansia sp. RSA 2599]
MQARSTRKSLNALRQPFKSPRRSDAGPATPTSTQEESSICTPTAISKKRKPAIAPSTPSPSRSTRVSTNPVKTPLKAPVRTEANSPTSKRLRTTPLSANAGRGRRRSRLSGLAAPTDEATRLLIQEKAELQRQLVAIKEEKTLLERAALLGGKDEAAAVDRLIVKWQIACSSASEDLFDLLKPVMEAQRQATDAGFGSAGFDDRGANGNDIRGAASENQLASASSTDVASDDDGPGSKQTEATDDPGSEDLDIPYMLKRLGIDPELF